MFLNEMAKITLKKILIRVLLAPIFGKREGWKIRHGAFAKANVSLPEAAYSGKLIFLIKAFLKYSQMRSFPAPCFLFFKSLQ